MPIAKRTQAISLLATMIVLAGTPEGAEAKPYFLPSIEPPLPEVAIVGEDVPSPDGRHLITHQTRFDGGFARERRMTFKDARTGKGGLFYKHERSVSVDWSPDSQRFILNDYWGSNGADCHIYSTPQLRSASPDTQVVRATNVRGILGNAPLHLYVACERWLSPSAVVVRLWGDATEQRSLSARMIVGLRRDVDLMVPRYAFQAPHGLAGEDDAKIDAALRALLIEDEDKAIAANGAWARREGKTLTLQTRGGNAVSLQNDTCVTDDGGDDVEHCTSHFFVAHLPERGGFLTLATYYEDSAFEWIDDTTGEVSVIADAPYFSPSGERLVASRNAPIGYGGIQLWRHQAGKLVMEWEHVEEEFGYSVLRWRGENEVELVRSRWEGGALVKVPVRLVRSASGWKLTTPSPTDAACKAVTQRVAKVIHPSAGPTSRWWCDVIPSPASPPGLYVIGLHSGTPCPADTPCSNLMGWFAVRKKDGRVYEWDMGEDRLGRPM